MKKIIVLGSGMVGSVMAIDLSKDHQVTISDIDQNTLHIIKKKCINLTTVCVDVTDKSELQNAISSFDIVVCAVLKFLGFNTIKNIIET